MRMAHRSLNGCVSPGSDCSATTFFYAWADGRRYAEGLVRALGASPYGYRCFIDNKEMGGGEAWRTSVRKALRRSSVMVLVASANALRRPAVLDEVQTFNGRGRPLIPIDFLDRIAMMQSSEPLYQFLEGRLRVSESAGDAALTTGQISPDIIAFLDSSFGFVRVARRLRAFDVATTSPPKLKATPVTNGAALDRTLPDPTVATCDWICEAADAGSHRRVEKLLVLSSAATECSQKSCTSGVHERVSKRWLSGCRGSPPASSTGGMSQVSVKEPWCRRS
jgi:TIR domain